jgi:hypothetical protein
MVLFSYICLAMCSFLSSLNEDLGRPPFLPRARATVKRHDDGHEFAQAQLTLAHPLALAMLEQTLPVDWLKGLAKIIDITEHSDELAHRDSPYDGSKIWADIASIRGSLWAGKAPSLIPN